MGSAGCTTQQSNASTSGDTISSNHEEASLVLKIAVLLVAIISPILRAQIDVGGVAGTVKDPTGALVPNADLTLTNEATGVAQKIRSSSSGTYVFQAVPAGSYELKVEVSGFKTYVATGVQVHVQSVVTVDISLSVGRVNEALTVTSVAPLLQAQ